MKHILPFLLMIGLIACQQNPPQIESIEEETLSEAQIDSVLERFQFNYESPILLDSSRKMLIPISTRLLGNGGRGSKFSKDNYYDKDLPRYWNVLFFDDRTGETHLLTEEKIRISGIYAKKDQEYESEAKVFRGKILYQIADEDANQDGTLDWSDPEYLFVSELDGKQLTRISPAGEDLRFFSSNSLFQPDFDSYPPRYQP